MLSVRRRWWRGDGGNNDLDDDEDDDDRMMTLQYDAGYDAAPVAIITQHSPLLIHLRFILSPLRVLCVSSDLQF